jgi:RNA recognition motif-containing protein
VVAGTSLANPYLASYANSGNQPTSSKLLVSNLPMNFDEEAVYLFLKSFGKIKTLEMIKDPMTGKYAV